MRDDGKNRKLKESNKKLTPEENPDAFPIAPTPQKKNPAWC